jgi:hypothetical protein
MAGNAGGYTHFVARARKRERLLEAVHRASCRMEFDNLRAGAANGLLAIYRSTGRAPSSTQSCGYRDFCGYRRGLAQERAPHAEIV